MRPCHEPSSVEILTRIIHRNILQETAAELIPYHSLSQANHPPKRSVGTKNKKRANQQNCMSHARNVALVFVCFFFHCDHGKHLQNLLRLTSKSVKAITNAQMIMIKHF